jgi:hypothetical protein
MNPWLERLRETAREDVPIVAVSVRSNILDDTVWVVADELRHDEWPTDAPIYRHAEVKLLAGAGTDLLATVHRVKALFNARILAVTRHSRATDIKEQDGTPR